MALGKNPSKVDVSNAACMDIYTNSIPLIINGYTYVHAANHYKRPTPSVNALANALVKHENDDPQADALASGFVFGMC